MAWCGVVLCRRMPTVVCVDTHWLAVQPAQQAAITILRTLAPVSAYPTTVLLPAGEQQVGVLDARGVVPVAGNVMVFPHGGTKGSLVHEGSAVLKVSVP